MTDGARRPWLVAPALAAAVVAISFAAIFFREAAPTHPLVAAGLRLAVAAAVLLPKSAPALWAYRRRRRLVHAAALGGLFYGLHFGAWVTSLGLTSIAASVTLVTTTPLLLAVAAVVTGRDRPEGRLWALLALAAAGLASIGARDFGSGASALAGDGLALLGAAAMAGYLTMARRAGDEMDVWAFSGIATAVGAAVLLLAAAGAGLPLRAASARALGFIVLAALVPQLIGHSLLTWALRYTTPMVVGMAVVGEPVGATILGWWWLGETVAPPAALGCAVTLVAVTLAIFNRRRESPR